MSSFSITIPESFFAITLFAICPGVYSSTSLMFIISGLSEFYVIITMPNKLLFMPMRLMAA